MLLDEFEADWVARGRSRTTAYEYCRHLRRMGITDEPPSAAWMRDRISKRLDEVTSQTVLVETRAAKAFSKWWGEYFDDVDPLAKLRYPKVHQSPPQVIADDDLIAKLLHAHEAKTVINRDGGGVTRTRFEIARLRCLVLMARDTGMQRSAIARLTVTDVDLDRNVIIVRQTKVYVPRLVPVSSELRRELRRYLAKRAEHRHGKLPNLFIGTCGAVMPRGLADIVERACETAEIPEGAITMHSFRRRLSYVWAKANGAEDALQLIAGWRDGRMPARYRSQLAHQFAAEQFARIVG